MPISTDSSVSLKRSHRGAPSKTFAGIVALVMAVVFPYMTWLSYAEIADLHEHGQEEILEVLAQTGTMPGRKVTYRLYDAAIGGTRVRLSTTDTLAPNSRHSILFRPEQLSDYKRSEFFGPYVMGKKTETKRDIFVREMGVPFLWFSAIFEAFWVAGAWWLISSGRRIQPLPVTRASAGYTKQI